MRLSQSLIFLLLFTFGCESYKLSVKQVVIDQSALASSFAKTPDPLQECPPKGQELIIEWRLPPEILSEEPRLLLTLLFREGREEHFSYPIRGSSGSVTYSTLDEGRSKKRDILTYKAEIFGAEDRLLKEWKQQLWTHRILTEDEQDES